MLLFFTNCALPTSKKETIAVRTTNFKTKVSCKIENIPAGIGEPVFDKLQAELAKAMLSINAAKGFEYGLGFDSTKLYGSEMNDVFISDKNKSITTLSNNSGGILGGISNGMPLTFNVAFKPVSTIMQDQNRCIRFLFCSMETLYVYIYILLYVCFITRMQKYSQYICQHLNAPTLAACC
jgi:hypothetical protein